MKQYPSPGPLYRGNQTHKKRVTHIQRSTAALLIATLFTTHNTNSIRYLHQDERVSPVSTTTLALVLLPTLAIPLVKFADRTEASHNARKE